MASVIYSNQRIRTATGAAHGLTTLSRMPGFRTL